ncbi:MAG: hypothetical protein PHR81_03865 [Bacteroidales bacterium]|nr:hypothetical protein [Bacteroidales bacterium]
MKRKLLLPVFFLLIVVFSCRKDINSSWDEAIYIPLIHSTLDLTKILPDSLMQINPDNTLSLVYRYFFYNFNIDSLVKMPDTISQKLLPPVVGLEIEPSETFFNFTENTKLNIPDAELLRVDFKSGFFVFEIYSTFEEKIYITYKIPYATKNGLPFQVTEVVPAASGGNTVHYVKQYDISDYSLDLRGPFGLSYNMLSNTTVAVLDPEGNPYVLDNSDVFNFNVRFEDITVKYAKGYFGSNSYAFGPDTATITNIFDNIKSGIIDLEAVQFNLTIENRFGVDGQVVFEDFESYNSHNGNAITLNDPIIGQVINISRAIETYDPYAPVIPSKYFFDMSSSNIEQMIESMANKAIYKMKFTTNPLGNISAGNDFIYYDNYLNASINLEIPFSLIANELVLVDTVLLEMGEKPGQPASGVLNLIADNGFPFSADVQFYLVDENNQITDSVLVPGLIHAPYLDANYMVVTPKRTEIYIPVPESRIDNFFASKKLVIKAHFNTAGASHHVKIYSHYKAEIKLTGDFNYLIQL